MGYLCRFFVLFHPEQTFEIAACYQNNMRIYLSYDKRHKSYTPIAVDHRHSFRLIISRYNVPDQP